MVVDSLSMTLNGNMLDAIRIGTEVLDRVSDYSVSGDTVRIRKEYLSILEYGKHLLIFDFNEGHDCTLKITVTSSETLITGFTAAGQIGSSSISYMDCKVYFTVPCTANTNAITAMVTAGDGTVTPASGTPVAFTDVAGILQAEYIVTAQDGITTQKWIAICNKLSTPIDAINDKDAPKIKITSPKKEASEAEGPTVTISGEVSDSSMKAGLGVIVSLYVSIDDGEEKPLVVNFVKGTEKNNKYDSSGNFTFTVPVAAGSKNTFRIAAADIFDHTSEKNAKHNTVEIVPHIDK
jgi:hypothetical protein